MPGQLYEDGRVHVRASQCDHCLFSKDRLVSGSRARELVQSARSAEGGSFICHRGQVSDEHTAICRAWYDQYSQDDPILRLAAVMGIVTYVGPGES